MVRLRCAPLTMSVLKAFYPHKTQKNHIFKMHHSPGEIKEEHQTWSHRSRVTGPDHGGVAGDYNFQMRNTY